MDHAHVVNAPDHEPNCQPAQEADELRDWCNRNLTLPMSTSTDEFLAFAILATIPLRASEIAALASELGLNRRDVQDQIAPAAGV